jgi:serine protease AprX
MNITYRMSRFLATIAWLGLTLFPQPMTHQPTPAPQLHLHRGTFDIRAARQLAPTSATAAAAPGSYGIVQLYGPITPADRQALEQTGVRLLEYLPDYAYLVQGTDAQREAAARLPQVYAYTSFTLADKLAPALLRAVARGDTSTWQVRIISWQGEEGTLARKLETLGLGRQVAADASLLLQVSRLESVRWIEPVGHPRILNDRARSIMNVEPVWQDHQLLGAGQIVAVTDSGLDTGDLNTISPDFAGRIVATHIISAGGHWDDNHGHGTHVAGSIAGAGVQSGADPAQHDYVSSFAGVAPEASLAIQAFEAYPDGTVLGMPEDLYPLFAQVYTDGARLHSNSWGDYTGPTSDAEAAYGGYPYASQRTDEFVWDHPDSAIFFGAGNSGVDGTPGPLGLCTDGDGVIDPDSLLAPGTAKNVITVGATESDRSDGGLGAFPWLLINLCFTTQPIAIDTIANNPNGMAAFSSRGPADDGRTKPDIVAPGTNIVSNRSHVAGATTLWATHETYPDHYVYSGGTSMATPLVAGMGALMREWLVSQGYANPSAAAIKAALLNTTKDIAPGQYGTSDAQEIPFDRPNSVAGWGRADLGFIAAPAPYTLWLDDHSAGVTTGQMVTYTHSFTHPLQVMTNTQPLRVMLTWTDPPASLSAATQLVNDLDLQVVGPGGTIYYGNAITSGDRINNVEGVVVHNPPLGRYEVMVQAFNVPIFGQPYALAVTGPLSDTPSIVNDPPVAVDDSYITAEDTPLTVPAPGVLDNDSDADGDPLTAVLVSDVLTGTLALNTDGGFEYTPAPNYNGVVTFTYQTTDTQATSNLATVTVTVTAVNDPPVAADDSYITAEDTPLTVPAPGVLDNDSDADGDPLTAVMDSPLAGGTLVYSPSISGTLLFGADGSFIYTPTLGFSGVVSFTYHATDGTAESNIAIVEITVSERTVLLPIAMRNYP